MTRTGIGLVGFGAIARKHLATMRDCAEVEIAGVLDPVPAARAAAENEGLRSFADEAEFFAAPGLAGVILATPNHLHATGAIACIERGLPVLIEKPLSDTVAGGERILAAQAKHGTPVLVGHHRRHNPLLAKARAIVRSGRIGAVTAVIGLTLFLKPDDYFDVAWRREPGGGPVLINLIHDIDDLRFLCGEIAEVRALTSNARRGFAVEDTAAVILRFANGALATLVVSDTVAAPWSWELTAGENPIYPRRDENCYLIAGTKASLSIPKLELWHYAGAAGWLAPLTRERISVTPEEPFLRQLRHFVDVIHRHAEPLVTAADALRTLEVTLAVQQDLRGGSRAYRGLDSTWTD